MGTPNRTLIASIVQTQDNAKKRLRFYILITAIVGVIFIGSGLVVGDLSTVFGGLICTVIPALGVVITVLNIRQGPRKIDIFSDGFVISDSKSETVLESALWNEVLDIGISPDKGRQSAGNVGFLAFGILGSLIASSVSEGSGERDLFIYIPQKKKITIDTTYRDPKQAWLIVGGAARDAWADDARKAIESGGSYYFGNIQVLPTGIMQGKSNLNWNTVIDANRTNEQTVSILYNNPAKNKPQTMRVALGYKGEALIKFVRNQLGKKGYMPTAYG